MLTGAGSKGCRVGRACANSSLLKGLTLQDVQTRLVPGKEARVPEPFVTFAK